MKNINLENIESEIINLVSKQFNVSNHDLDSNTDLNKLGDDFDHIELIMKIEEVFEIYINDQEALELFNIKSIIYIFQTLLTCKQKAKIWVITRNAIATSHDQEILSLSQAGAVGMIKSLALECPQLWGGHIDVDSIEYILL